ncbi:MAG: hypothetical protein COZ49_00825 [Candidatus Yonathbacteria bacterium CG_4_10_14_3_um_filter_47_65]|uniref:Uncharacterized protein n=2 Tax=Parcubacteria group TaxID=1794811 RepID=A0A2M8D6G9_9BACT|nr:MAG: hypothetical protein AUJ44_03790 [Candidatus Nomurabacteria bacterium CG1_02_47_685]PIQ32238.1 MAG: hypothetical protein COW61_02155 [Candidatus Yonathbacteria bacterium CG17_big_fil_post_rev_8_21_14_2_50_46_19]PIX56701.1 MAG: hypothetical protein COZ49_00825 [Candidatus Yonathbacteria bacterium CG_4_10_14_3_um_filter_47_65]PIY57894.1 MAG: hypothetical protein COY99_00955 [Candidatus Yonathbacteria bacterium CG_4_10_14_0_8_um_filter_47_645]PJB82522.1 MAG: hypothetical protein CO088_0336
MKYLPFSQTKIVSSLLELLACAIAPVTTSQKFPPTIFLLRAPPEKKVREISTRFRPPSIRAGWDDDFPEDP